MEWEEEGGAIRSGHWSPAWIRAEAVERDITDVANLASLFYGDASYGWVEALTGDFWPWCPMWFAAFSSQQIQHVGRTCIEYERQERAGSLSTRVKTILPWTRAIMDLVRGFRGQQDHERWLNSLTPKQRAKLEAEGRI